MRLFLLLIPLVERLQVLIYIVVDYELGGLMLILLAIEGSLVNLRLLRNIVIGIASESNITLHDAELSYR